MSPLKSALVLVLAVGCAGTFGSGYTAHSTAGRVLAAAETGTAVELAGAILCDRNQTQWARDGGKWDRTDASGHMLGETDPLIGTNYPSAQRIDAFTAGALLAVAVGFDVLPRVGAPRWLRDGLLVLVAAGETENIIGNQQRLVGMRTCGF